MIPADYNIVVIASDKPGEGLPRFARDDIAGIADFIAAHVARG
jgi:hypothetical protein